MTYSAIRRSINRDDIVTVELGPEETMESALAQLTGDPTVTEYDFVAAESTRVETTRWDVWGKTADGKTWRVVLHRTIRVTF